jgi:NAD-dependent SIR2 family protein deacetylase
MNGYLFSIQKGMSANFYNQQLCEGKYLTLEEKLRYLKEKISSADAILIGAGAGLSTSAGLTYKGERFTKYFFDFAQKYGITDMYSGGFYPFENKEIFWAWWARHIYYNRYINPPKPVYENLFELVKDKNYYVITTNVDHLFQKSGFDKTKLFYTQGDYGLFQSVNPQIRKTYDNETTVMKMMSAQGFIKDEEGIFQVPQDRNILMQIPTELIPKCPDDNSDMVMNLRSDNTFVEDDGWHKASTNYYNFITKNKDSNILYLELGVGLNTPVIIKFPFWQMTTENKNASYICVNYKESFCPEQIKEQAVCIDCDIAEVLNLL